MTIEELIKELQKYPKETDVYLQIFDIWKTGMNFIDADITRVSKLHTYADSDRGYVYLYSKNDKTTKND